MDQTFLDAVLRKFLEEEKIKSEDFPFNSYADFFQSFVDDLSIFSWRTMPKTYAGKYSPEDLHLLYFMP